MHETANFFGVRRDIEVLDNASNFVKTIKAYNDPSGLPIILEIDTRRVTCDFFDCIHIKLLFYQLTIYIMPLTTIPNTKYMVNRKKLFVNKGLTMLRLITYLPYYILRAVG